MLPVKQNKFPFRRARCLLGAGICAQAPGNKCLGARQGDCLLPPFVFLSRQLVSPHPFCAALPLILMKMPLCSRCRSLPVNVWALPTDAAQLLALNGGKRGKNACGSVGGPAKTRISIQRRFIYCRLHPLPGMLRLPVWGLGFFSSQVSPHVEGTECLQLSHCCLFLFLC